MAHSEQYCDSYFLSFKDPVYVWGANITNIKDKPDPHSFMMSLWKTYGSSSGQYNQVYYENKYQDAMTKSGFISDCSGFLYQLNGDDLTAQGYFNHCQSTGDISSIDLSHSCLLFRGSTSKINHVGYYCHQTGESIEMANSQDNFKRQKFNSKNWTFWGKPEFIDYSSAPTSLALSKPTYLYKGIDISTYQKNLNYQALKDAGVDFAIVKIINKQGNMDTMYRVHTAALDTVGIKVQAVYNYSYAVTVDKAITDANKVLEYLGPRQCAVCLDVEDNVQKGLGTKLIDIINAYQKVIEGAGRSFLLYSGKSFFETYIKPYSANLNCKQFWIARYYKSYTEMDYDEDPDQVYKPMDGIVAWQYTSSGIIKGVDGRLDLNVMYKEIESSSSSLIVASPVTSDNIVSALNGTIKNTVHTNGKSLNVRNKPSMNGQIIGKMLNGSNLIAFGVDKTGEWIKLSVPKDQWCSSQWVDTVGCGEVIAEKSLYVRSSDSKSGEIWGVYKAGTKVKLLHRSTNTGWYLTIGIGKDGQQVGGWCSDKYIRTN